jgi:hypothetical protein
VIHRSSARTQLNAINVRIDDPAAGDVLACTPSGQLTCSFANGILLISAPGLALEPFADFRATIRTVTYSNTNGSAASTTPRNLRFTVGTGIQDGSPSSDTDQRHYYLMGETTSGWFAAKTACAQSLFGMTGYLVTITSADENALLAKEFPTLAWIGGSDLLQQGEWRWRTGPESSLQVVGEIFWEGGPSSTGGSAPSGLYANWKSTEPADFNGPGLDAGMTLNSQEFAAMEADGTWSTHGGNDINVGNELCEYGGAFGASRPVLKAAEYYTLTFDLPPVDAGVDGAADDSGADAAASDADVNDASAMADANEGDASAIVDASASDANAIADATDDATSNGTDAGGSIADAAMDATIDDAGAGANDSGVVLAQNDASGGDGSPDAASSVTAGQDTFGGGACSVSHRSSDDAPIAFVGVGALLFLDRRRKKTSKSA